MPDNKQVIENITNTNVTNNTYPGGGNKGLAGLLVVVPLAAFLGASISHHGGCCTTPTPTPEPVSMTLLATGVVGLAISRKRRRS